MSRLSLCLLPMMCALAGACRAGHARPEAPVDPERGENAGFASAVAQGRYLVDHLYGCADCHSPKGADGRIDPARYLAGRVCLFDVDPAPGRGCINSRNLTNHARGLANVSDDRAVKDMFLEGLRPDGKPLHPMMPAYEFHNMPAAHADAIVAYLRTVPGVDHLVPPSEPPFATPPPLPTPPIDMAAIPAVPPGVPDAASAGRGRVLAAVACLGCHTPSAPERRPGGPVLDLSRLFAGGRPFTSAKLGLASPPYPARIFSQNLTHHATGIGAWQADDIVRVLMQGKDRAGKGVCAPMPSSAGGSYAGLRARDARDIANYLVTLPGIDHPLPNPCAVDGP